MAITLKQHIAYSKSPELFMKERWLSFNSFNNMKCDYLNPFDYQLDFIKTIHNVPANIIVKSRQMHVSSMMALYIAWYVLFNQEKEIAILSNSLDSGKRILDNIRTILQMYSVDDENNGKVTQTFFHWEDDFERNNKTEIKLKNGCRIKVFSPSPDAGRGYALDFIYIDEAAFIKDFEYIWMAIGMCMSAKKDSKTVIASTPQDNSWFNKMYLNSNKEGYFNSIRLHWSIHPEYSKNITEDRDQHSPYTYSSPWFEEMKNRLRYSEKAIEQEFECVVNYKEETNKTKTISLRVDSELYRQLQNRLRKGESASDYIRRLIEKDVRTYL
jgi:hypothetical protein